ncbi:MAG: long-chain acyl-CoA synthetase [Thermoleophilaceae bacterium]|nr:long-chain acyl-CoA synthetase [Thermoleophilaceae bacterium]
MEAGTVGTPSGTGATTMAGLAALAASSHSDLAAIKRKVGDEWVATTYGELGVDVSEVARGLIDLGVEPGERISILANTRPEWTLANLGILAAGAASVSIYQTNSPEECHYVLEHSESSAVFVEDEEQLAKIREVRDQLPALEHVIVFDGKTSDEAISLDDLRERGRGREQSELDERTASVTPDDACVFIYTSGTTGPPKGVILTHGNYRAMCDMVEERADAIGPGQTVYLFLPLAHAFALLIQFVALELGAEIAYWQKDPQKIIPDLMEVKPTYFPSVPRIFEKLYTLANASAEDPEKLKQAVRVGMKVRQMRERGEEVPAELQQAFDQADEKLFKNVRMLFGGQVQECVTGAAPIAPEILEFFYACGVPIMEGYGMTETSTSASVNRAGAYKFGSVGQPMAGVEAKIAEDGELLLRGANIFKSYYKNEEATRETLIDGWLHTGDLGRIDEDGYIFITGRKKDIIITAGGKNITPANIENGLKQSRWISQAVVVGDRRPYLVALITIDPEEIPAFAQEHELAPEDVLESDAVRAEVQKAVDEVNAKVGRVEQVKKFAILDHDLSQATGELTPTLKVKRNVVNEKFADVVESLYSG